LGLPYLPQGSLAGEAPLALAPHATTVYAEGQWRLHVKPFFGHFRAGQVSTDLVKRYIAQRQREADKRGRLPADATINRELAFLKTAFHLATKYTPPKARFVPYIPMLKENNSARDS
jgi:hypothetical protein